MQNKEQSALLVHRENYIVPKGEEHVVHYKIAKMDGNGNFVEKPRIVKSGVKLFETNLKVELENQGYTIEILSHPMGRYSNVKIESKDVIIANKDAEIDALKAELEALRAMTPKVEDVESEPKEEKKKGGRPRKEVENAD